MYVIACTTYLNINNISVNMNDCFYTFCYMLYKFAINIISFFHDEYLTKKLYRKYRAIICSFKLFLIFFSLKRAYRIRCKLFYNFRSFLYSFHGRNVRYHTSAISNTFCFFSKDSVSFPRRNLHMSDTGDFSDLCNHIYRYSINQRNVLHLCIVGKTKIYKINLLAEHE